MCKAMDQLFQRMRDEGKLNTLKELLKVKLGTLSSPLEKQLTNTDRKSTRLNSSHTLASRMPSSA